MIAIHDKESTDRVDSITVAMGEADIEVKASQWRYVEVGRVVYFLNGPYAGRLAAIAEIIDHKRVCIPWS